MTFDDNAYACAGPSNGPSQPLDGRLEHHGAIHLRQHATIRTHGSNHINQPRLQAPAHCSRRVAAHASRIIDMPERTGGMCRRRRIQRNRERGTHHHECGHSRAWSWHGFGRSIIWDGRVSPAAGIIHGNPSVTPRERYRPPVHFPRDLRVEQRAAQILGRRRLMAGHRGPEHGQWHIELEAGADFIAFDIVMPATVAPMPRITGRIVRSETFPRILEHCFHLLSFF